MKCSSSIFAIFVRWKLQYPEAHAFHCQIILDILAQTIFPLKIETICYGMHCHLFFYFAFLSFWKKLKKYFIKIYVWCFLSLIYRSLLFVLLYPKLFSIYNILIWNILYGLRVISEKYDLLKLFTGINSIYHRNICKSILSSAGDAVIAKFLYLLSYERKESLRCSLLNVCRNTPEF